MVVENQEASALRGVQSWSWVHVFAKKHGDPIRQGMPCENKTSTTLDFGSTWVNIGPKVDVLGAKSTRILKLHGLFAQGLAYPIGARPTAYLFPVDETNQKDWWLNIFTASPTFAHALLATIDLYIFVYCSNLHYVITMFVQEKQTLNPKLNNSKTTYIS